MLICFTDFWIYKPKLLFLLKFATFTVLYILAIFATDFYIIIPLIMPKFDVLSIIIPVYNEERTIHILLHHVLQVNLPAGIEKELVIVNDCSKDNTKVFR